VPGVTQRIPGVTKTLYRVLQRAYAGCDTEDTGCEKTLYQVLQRACAGCDTADTGCDKDFVPGVTKSVCRV
jgi:hypothetical protein